VKATNLMQKINLFHNFILKLYFLYMKVKVLYVTGRNWYF